MESRRRGGLEGLSIGFMVIAFAVALLVAWMLADWWMFIPIFLMEAGAFWALVGMWTGTLSRPSRRGISDSSYYVFWGTTLVIVGAMWVVNSEFPDHLLQLFIVFLIWVGAVAMILSLRNMRKRPGTAK